MTPEQPKEADVPWFWLALVCAVGIVFWAFVNLPSQRHGHQDYSNDAKYSNEATLPVVISSASIDAKNAQKSQGNDPQEIARGDLAAQWVMADIAWIGLFIGGIGIGYIAWTLRETRSASEAAHKTLDVASFTSELELQPYLKASGITLTEEHVDKFHVYGDAQCIFHGTITVTNEGKTPAWIKSVNTETAVQVSIAGVGKIKNRKGTSPQEVYIGPNSSEEVVVFMGFHMDTETPPDSIPVSKVFYNTWTTIEYDDVFSLKTKHRKEMWLDHGIKLETVEVLNDDGVPEMRLFLKLLKTGMGLRKKDVHPSKR